MTRDSGESVLFHFPYERLKMSGDDGVRNLYLDFGTPEGEMVRSITHKIFTMNYVIKFQVLEAFRSL